MLVNYKNHRLGLPIATFVSGIAKSWWRHQMETFSALLAICAGNSPVPCEFPAQRPVTRSFEVFFDLRPNKRLSKQSWVWWFETPSRPLWRHRNVKKLGKGSFGKKPCVASPSGCWTIPSDGQAGMVWHAFFKAQIISSILDVKAKLWYVQIRTGLL